MKENNNPAKTYNVTALQPDDWHTIYDEIYCKNNLVMEDWFDEPFLNADFHYCKEDFLEILEDKNVFSIVAIERIFLKEPNKVGHYYGNQRKGFMCFEQSKDKTINIIFFEALNEVDEIYTVLLEHLKNKASEKSYRKIILEIPDGRWAQIKGATAAGLTLEKTVHYKDKPDIYIYSCKIKQI